MDSSKWKVTKVTQSSVVGPVVVALEDEQARIESEVPEGQGNCDDSSSVGTIQNLFRVPEVLNASQSLPDWDEQSEPHEDSDRQVDAVQTEQQETVSMPITEQWGPDFGILEGDRSSCDQNVQQESKDHQEASRLLLTVAHPCGPYDQEPSSSQPDLTDTQADTNQPSDCELYEERNFQESSSGSQGITNHQNAPGYTDAPPNCFNEQERQCGPPFTTIEGVDQYVQQEWSDHQEVTRVLQTVAQPCDSYDQEPSNSQPDPTTHPVSDGGLQNQNWNLSQTADNTVNDHQHGSQIELKCNASIPQGSETANRRESADERNYCGDQVTPQTAHYCNDAGDRLEPPNLPPSSIVQAACSSLNQRQNQPDYGFRTAINDDIMRDVNVQAIILRQGNKALKRKGQPPDLSKISRPVDHEPCTEGAHGQKKSPKGRKEENQAERKKLAEKLIVTTTELLKGPKMERDQIHKIKQLNDDLKELYNLMKTQKSKEIILKLQELLQKGITRECLKTTLKDLRDIKSRANNAISHAKNEAQKKAEQDAMDKDFAAFEKKRNETKIIAEDTLNELMELPDIDTASKEYEKKHEDFIKKVKDFEESIEKSRTIPENENAVQRHRRLQEERLAVSKKREELIQPLSIQLDELRRMLGIDEDEPIGPLPQ